MRCAGSRVLLVAPTGGGKTLAGFLPSLIDLAEAPPRKPGMSKRVRALHTLYISPLKALAVDVARNLETPGRRDGTCRSRSRPAPATRPPSRRQRQRHAPPDILLTTPEQLALLLAHPRGAAPVRESEDRGAGRTARPAQFQARRSAGAGSGAACARWRPAHRRVGLSATVADPEAAAALSDAAADGRRSSSALVRRPGRRQAADRHQRLGCLCALGRASRAPRHGRCDGGDQARARPRWSSSTPAARPSAPSRNCGA